MPTGRSPPAKPCSRPSAWPATARPGIPGAPHLNDAAAWGPRIGQGYDTLLEHALKGKGAMPPQGGGDFEDLEIGRAVVYMANAGGAKFPVPERPAAAARRSSAAALQQRSTAAAAGTGCGAPARRRLRRQWQTASKQPQPTTRARDVRALFHGARQCGRRA